MGPEYTCVSVVVLYVADAKFDSVGTPILIIQVADPQEHVAAVAWKVYFEMVPFGKGPNKDAG